MMSERTAVRYKRLFEVRVLHHYWLDEGGLVFDAIAERRTRELRLLAYDARSLFGITPTATAVNRLKAVRAVVLATGLGFIVAVPEQAVIGNDALFEFCITVRAANFANYTALTLQPQRIVEVGVAGQQQVYRYKENVPVLSNLTGVSRGAGNNRVLFLSKEIPAASATDSAEFLTLAGNTLQQLCADQPGARSHTLSTQARKHPVYVHQGDIETLTLPGESGKTLRGIRLRDDMPDTVFALIRMHARRPGDSQYSVIDNQGHAKSKPPVFEIRLKNRSTVRQYINKETRALEFEEPLPLPLTFFGNSGSKRKPSETLAKPITSNAKVVKLVSEIFV